MAKDKKKSQFAVLESPDPEGLEQDRASASSDVKQSKSFD